MKNQSVLCAALVAISISVASVADAKKLTDDELKTVTEIARDVRRFSIALKLNGTKPHYTFLYRALEKCIETTNPLLADGADRDTRLAFEYDEKQIEITLIESWRECEAAREQLREYYEKLQEKLAEAKARDKAKLDALKKTLEGEKRSFYFNNKYYEIVLFGKGGQRLTTARALQRSSLWFEVVNYEDDLGVTRWEMRRHRFKGNKYKGTTEKHGRGLNPRSSDFR